MLINTIRHIHLQSRSLFKLENIKIEKGEEEEESEEEMMSKIHVVFFGDH